MEMKNVPPRYLWVDDIVLQQQRDGIKGTDPDGRDKMTKTDHLGRITRVTED